MHASIKRALVATAACATLAGGSAAFGVTAASASAPHGHSNATLVCGFKCYDLSSLVTGPNKIQNVHNGGASINLRDSGVLRVNEDFTSELPITTVGDTLTPGTACGEGILAPTSVFCISTEYVNDNVYEADWSPDSNDSASCVGAPGGNLPGRVSLQPCGVSARTLWVADANDSVTVGGLFYTPWLNGADTSFSHPLVLTVNPSSKHPLNVLRVSQENESAGFVPDTQQFNITFGPVA